MANGYFERGEMYDILSGDAMDGEILSHRPGIIVSSERGNKTAPVVTMIFTTTTTRDISVNHRFTMRGREQYALCSQIVTVNKKRLTNYYGKLSDSDMRAIDGCLEEALDLGYVDDTAVKEKEKEIAVLKLKMEEQSKETAKLNEKIAAHADETISLKIEIEMWRRMYEKALNQLCNVKLAGDINRRTAPPKEPPIAQAVTPSKPSIEKKPELVDINSASFSELKSCGFTDNIVVQIIQKRPHSKVEDLKNLPGLTSMGYQILSKKVCCIAQPEPKKIVSALVEPDTEYEAEAPTTGKVNINTATAKEITEKLGFGSQYYGHKIVKYRNENGRYVDLEELRDVKDLPKNFLDRYRDRIVVGEDESSQKQTSAGKVNVNKMASAQQLKNLTGMSMRCAAAVIAHRKKNGDFKSLEELTSVDGFGNTAMRRYGHMLEV